MSRELTEAEIRTKFLLHVWDLIEYWEKTPNRQTVRERMAGLAFSILTALDGEAGALPGFYVVPCTTSEDKEYYMEVGENWYPHLPKEDADKLCDIGGSLHEVFYSLDPNRHD